jgi:hypothetical protein
LEPGVTVIVPVFVHPPEVAVAVTVYVVGTVGETLMEAVVPSEPEGPVHANVTPPVELAVRVTGVPGHAVGGVCETDKLGAAVTVMVKVGVVDTHPALVVRRIVKLLGPFLVGQLGRWHYKIQCTTVS